MRVIEIVLAATWCPGSKWLWRMAFFRRRDVKRVLSTKQRNGKRMVSHRWYDFCLPFGFLSRDLNLEASQILFWWACSARLVFFVFFWCSTLSRFSFKWIYSVNYRRTQLVQQKKYVTRSKGDQTPIVLYWTTFVPVRFHLGNLLPPIHGGCYLPLQEL